VNAATCRLCGRAILGPAELAAVAERVRALVAGAVSLSQAGLEMEDNYGGPRELRCVLEKQLLTAEGLALDLARAAADAAACFAGTCRVPAPAPRGRGEQEQGGHAAEIAGEVNGAAVENGGPARNANLGGGVHDGRQR
jgi:hypothetical protein